MIVAFCVLTISYACVSVLIEQMNQRILHNHRYREAKIYHHRRSSTLNNGRPVDDPFIQPYVQHDQCQRNRRRA